jgi:general secretion pathway protein C
MKHRSVYVLTLFVMLLLFSRPTLVTAQDLGLRLVGTALAEDPGQGLAVIENESTGKQRPYREGDQVGAGLIKKIFYGKVVIATGTGDAVLYVGSGGSTAGHASAPQTASLDRKEVDSSLPDYTHLMRQIRVRPQFEAGHPRGFVIYNIGTGSIFEQMGLKDGDVIVSVNDRILATSQPVVEFYDALMEGETVSLEVMRGDSTQRLLLEIQ